MTTLARQPLTYATNLAMALRIRPNITAAYERSYLSTECTEVVCDRMSHVASIATYDIAHRSG